MEDLPSVLLLESSFCVGRYKLEPAAVCGNMYDPQDVDALLLCKPESCLPPVSLVSRRTQISDWVSSGLLSVGTVAYPWRRVQLGHCSCGGTRSDLEL